MANIGILNPCLGNGAVQQQLTVIATCNPRLPQPTHVV